MAKLANGLCRREFLMLAHTYKEGMNVAGMLVSIKLDGQRCLWDGGVTTGMKKRDVPWANNAKDERYKRELLATGLWSRFGNVIHAPDAFIKGLPKGVMLDGELYQDRGKFQETRTIVSRLPPEDDDEGYRNWLENWRKVTYHTFDLPSSTLVFQDGHVNVPNFAQEIQLAKCNKVVGDVATIRRTLQEAIQVMNLLYLSKKRGTGVTVWQPVEFTYLSLDEGKAQKRLQELLAQEVARGGEGLMLRHPESVWTPKRTNDLLKVKPQEFDEGVVQGWHAGKGKLHGMMGNLIVRWNKVDFELSGFTDEERQLNGQAKRWASVHAGEEAPSAMKNGVVAFQYGAKMRFTYRTLTDDGIPREARFKRS